MKDLRLVVLSAAVAAWSLAASAGAAVTVTFTFDEDPLGRPIITSDVSLPAGLTVSNLDGPVFELPGGTSGGTGAAVYVIGSGFTLSFTIGVPAGYDLLITDIRVPVANNGLPTDLMFRINGADLYKVDASNGLLDTNIYAGPDVLLASAGVDSTHLFEIVNLSTPQGTYHTFDNIAMSFDLIDAPEPTSLVALAAGGLVLARRVRGCRGR